MDDITYADFLADMSELMEDGILCMDAIDADFDCLLDDCPFDFIGGE